MDIKAVLIDIDNTILDFNKSAYKASQNIAKSHGIELPEAYFEVFLKINNELWSQLECGNIEKPEIYRLRFKRIFEELKITADFNAFEEDFRKEMRSVAELIDGADEILRYLSSKYPVYTASNASKFQQEVRLKNSGLWGYLSGMFTSEEIGWQKPAKEFFYACTQELYPIPASQLVMIGDSVDADIIGAKNFGLKTIWFNYNRFSYDNYNFTDFYVNSLCDIKNIL